MLVMRLWIFCQSSLMMVCNISVMTLLMRIAVNFRGFIATSFPQIINLLKLDDNPGAREASLDVLLELSEHSM